MLPLLIVVPLIGLIVLNLNSGRMARRWSERFVFLLAVLQVLLVLVPHSEFLKSSDVLRKYFAFDLEATNLSRVLLLSIGIVMFVTAHVARTAISDEIQRRNFFNILLVALIGMNGAVLVKDVFSLYVFLEVTSVSSFIAIAFNRDKNALEGAFKYLIFSTVATIMMLSAVSLLLLLAGGTSFETVGQALAPSGGNVLVKVAMGVFVCGLFIKGGLMPFHGWLPDAYSAAPAPVSVLLAGVATKASGIYAMIRLVTDVFPASAAIGEVLLLIGAISIVGGALAALGQVNLKRLLSYSSVSQVGYIILALGCASSNDPVVAKLGLAGAVFHLFNHSIFKSLLFVNSAALEQRLGTTDMNKMGGLGAKMPLSGLTSVIAALSTAGVPPFSGFWSKLIIVIALWKGNHYVYAAIAVMFSVVTLGYLLTMQRKIFFGTCDSNAGDIREAGYDLAMPAVALAAVTTALGVLIPYVWDTFLLPISSIF